MAKMIKRKDVWTVRYFVPKPLQAVAGCTEIWRSTGTSILREAEHKQHALIVRIQKELEAAARSAPVGPRSTEWVRMVTDELRQKVDAGSMNTDDAQELLATLIERHLDARGLDPNTVQPADMAPAHLASIRAARRLKPSKASLSLLKAIDLHLDEKAATVNASTIGRQRTVLEAFDKWSGHVDLAEVRRREASDYMRDVLLKSGHTAKTQTWHLSALSSLFSWAILHDYYEDANPWSGLSASIRVSSRGVKKERRRPWSTDELKKLDALPDDSDIKQAALLCLYTGMRTDEACSLKAADVDLAAKTLEVVAGKSHDAVRVVPIHRRLMPLIKRLHGAATDAGKEHLIAGLVPGGKDKKRSHNLSKRAGRWIRERVTKDENLVLYNVRHTFATALENAGVAPSVITRLLGQTQKGLALSTYSGGLDLPALRKAVDKLPSTWPTAS